MSIFVPQNHKIKYFLHTYHKITKSKYFFFHFTKSQFEYAFRKYINPLWVPAATHDNEVDPIFFQSSFPSSLVVRWKLITPLCSLIIVIRHGERQPQPSRLMHSGLYGIKMGINKSVSSLRPQISLFIPHEDYSNFSSLIIVKYHGER